MAPLARSRRTSRRASGVARWSAERPSKRGRPVSPGASKGGETTRPCAGQNAMFPLRANGALKPNALRESGPWALLEAKKRAAAPETANPAADMAFDAAAEEIRQHINQACRIARSDARKKVVGNSEMAGVFPSASNAQAIESFRGRHCHHKSTAPRSVPNGFGF
ncbi:hypothetical protein ERJ75_001466600 [Trypanosoma vivax]|nr:hypothetical protein ERJ75_001467100 [Trypanosoma vivax]KAH8607030.1 hypothetical protein ERJ75_001466600 [Trypanosoma vivax]